MPVNGITNRNLTTQQFRWTSLRTIYSIFCCGSLASYAVITLSYNITKKMTIESFGETLTCVRSTIARKIDIPTLYPLDSLLCVLRQQHHRHNLLPLHGAQMAHVDREMDAD